MLRCLTIIILMLFLVPFQLNAQMLTIVTLDSPPQSYLDKGTPAGFLVEIVEEAVKRAGYTSDIKVVPWKRAMVMVEKGTADAIFNAGYNEERNKFLRYPETSLITEKVVALRRAGAKVYLSPDFADAEKLIVGVGRAYYYGEKVDRVLKEKRFKRIEEVPNIDLNIKKLLLGRIDLFFGDYYPVIKFLNDTDQLDEVEAILSPESGLPLIYSTSETYLAFSRKKNPEAFLKVSAELKKMKEDGSYRNILIRYLPLHEGF